MGVYHPDDKFITGNLLTMILGSKIASNKASEFFCEETLPTMTIPIIFGATP